MVFGEIATFIFELAVNIIQVFIAVNFVRQFLSSKDNHFLSVTGFWATTAIMLAMLTIISHYFNYFAFDVVIGAIILMIYAFVCLNGKILIKILISITSMSLITIITSSVSIILSVVTQESVQNIMMKSPVLRYLCIILISVIYFFVTKIILRIRNRRFDLFKWTDWVAFILIPLLTTLVIILMMTISINNHDVYTQQLFFMIICISSIFIGFITNVMMVKVSEDSEIKLRYSLLHQQYTYQLENINQIKINAEQMSSLRHDLKNKISCIEEMIKADKINEALEFCNKCSGEINNSSSVIYTKNYVMDAILNSKSALCKKNNIQLVLEIGSDICKIDDIDLCIIIGNLIDNAIEAEIKLKSNRCIYFGVLEKDPYYSISVKNRIESSVLENNPDLITTKTNSSEHGIGKKNIEEAVARNNGEICYYEENGNFCCGVLLKIPCKSKIQQCDKEKAMV